MADRQEQAEGFVGEFDHGRGWYGYSTKRFKTITLHGFWVNELTEDEAALGALLPHVLRRGTRRFPDLVAIERELENLYGAEFRAEVGKVGDKQLISFHLELVNGEFLPGNPDMLGRGLDFLAEVLFNPRLGPNGFDGDVVEQEKELLRRQISALINDKGQYAMHRLLEIMADGRRFGVRKTGRTSDVDQITPERLYAYYNHVKNERPFVLFAVGDIDLNRVQTYVEQLSAGTRGARLTSVEPFVSQRQGNEVVDRQDVRQGKVLLGYGTDIALNHPQYPALMMYSGVLGGFPHSKLFVNVREKASLAYYAYARVDAALALMVIGAGIEFNDYEATRKIIDQQLQAMRQGDISDQEMQFTLKAFTNDILSEEDTASQLIGRQLETVLLGGGLHGAQLIDALSAVSVADIQRVAANIQLDTAYFLTEMGAQKA